MAPATSVLRKSTLELWLIPPRPRPHADSNKILTGPTLIRKHGKAMGKRWNRRAFAALDSLRQIWHYGRFCVAEINESITCLDNLPNSK